MAAAAMSTVSSRSPGGMGATTKSTKKTVPVKASDLSENPYLHIIDIDDILEASCLLKPETMINEQRKLVTNLLLRHNSELRKCYRHYTNAVELGENQRKLSQQAKKAKEGK